MASSLTPPNVFSISLPQVIFPTSFPPLFLLLLKGLCSWVPLLVLLTTVHQLSRKEWRRSKPFFALSQILRSCLSLPKISVAICTCPSHYISDALSCFDCSLATFISDLIGAPLPEWSQLKSSLPISLSGLGVRRAAQHASAAYLASINQSKDLMADMLCCSPPLSDHLTSSLSSVALAANRSDWSSIADIDIPISQKHLSYAIDQANISCLLSSAPSTRFKALALSTSSPHAGDWLHVIPSSALGLHMLDWEFRLCLLYWLGVVLSREDWICPVCSSNSDPYGDHGFLWW